MLLHKIRSKERDRENSKRDFIYLKDEEEIEIVEKIHSKTIIERIGSMSILIFFLSKLFLKEKTLEVIILAVPFILMISIFTIIKRWFGCTRKITSLEISSSYINWIAFKRLYKIITIGFLLNSILMYFSSLNNIYSGIKILEYYNSFIIGSIMTIVGFTTGIIVNYIRGKLIEVTFENMAEGLKKGQIDIAKKSLEEESKVRMLWGEGYIIVNRQLEVLIEKVEALAKEEESSLIDRTELITNASHDIRTPLTSIINYIDILKNKDITNDEREEFINILEAKIKRLKALLEDLEYATNFSIGEIQVNNEEVDVVKLLNLAIEESKDSIEAKGLDLISDFNVEESKAPMDKNNIIRVFQNLLSNISKYSLEGSRVYIELNEFKSEDSTYKNDKCRITFKNISKDKLNIEPSELIKRFKRGDGSRNTLGHGLGLDIANSLVKVQGGEMKIDIQGDLFRVDILIDL
ncbi:histidine kinase dimerization/phospho-acceptor domain-containing protein [Clostridium sp.]|uniref:sensor histidine kinase n=1 Tax=Clostridium sp. TaxID=1506 RepID=UPI003F3BE77D